MKNKRSAKIRKSIADILRKIADKIVPPKAETKESPNEQEYREPLAPRILTEKDVHYSSVKELAYAIQQPECKNIAITGVYGSGKSSIINTYVNSLPRYKKKKVLRISLSNFCETKIQADDLPALKQYEDEVEYKICQHIFFKANQRKTRQTRYARLSHISILHAIVISIAILLSVVALTIICWPNNAYISEHIHTWYANRLFCLFCPNRSMALLVAAILYLSFVGVYLLTYLLRRFHRVKLSKIKGDKIELEIPAETSFFGKYLDELIYFFKAGGYQYVIFEDLDRLLYPEQLFLKIRELNILLNESDYFRQHHRQIKFIYAIRDDVFKDEIRIKCFDYIIAVVPVVDKHNDSDYLVSQYHKNLLKSVSEKDLYVLGMYINGQRELNNIINEFVLYKRHLLSNDSKSATKLLAILIYKNMFPSDYASSYAGNGLIHMIFQQKVLFYKPLIADAEKYLNEAIVKEQTAQHNIEESRHRILTALTSQNVTELIIKGKSYSLDQFEKSDTLFEKFERDQISKYVINDEDGNSTFPYDFKFKTILEEQDPDNIFEEEMFRYHENLIDARRDKAKWSSKIELTKILELSEILNILDGKQAKDIMLKIADGKYSVNIIDTLFVFLKEGYIQEDFASYMSYSYPGSLTERDYYFIDSVLQDIALDYDYALDTVSVILERLKSNHFLRKSILNISLCDKLLSEKNSNLLPSFIETARKDAKFIIEFAHKGKNVSKFFSNLFENWDNCVSLINDLEDATDQEFMWLSFFNYALDNISLLDEERVIIESKYSFLCNHCEELNLSNLKRILSKYQLRFDRLQVPNEKTQSLFNMVLIENRYQINQDNLSVICGDEFTTKSYTSILKLDVNVRRYLLKDINSLVSLFPESDVEESEEASISLINNQRLTDAILSPYLKRQVRHIDYDEEKTPNYIARAKVLFETDVINPVWKNIECLGTDLTNMKEFIVPFVKAHINELGKQTRYTVGNPLRNLLMLDNETLTTDEFKKIITCFHYCFNVEDINDLNPDRIEIIIKSNYISYSLDGMAFASACSADLFASYLLGHFDQFINDKDFPIETLPNAVGIQILASNLSVKDKDAFLKKSLHIEDEDAAKYSEAVCKFYATDGDINSANIPEVLKALTFYQGGESWWDKIEIVNRINASIPYDLDTETQMLEALGGGYPALNHYRQHSKEFQRNDQNITLLTYLGQNHKYISKVFVGDNAIKVTFRNG